jgi:hypothetical protein
MTKFHFTLKAVVLSAILLSISAVGQAQANRTWVASSAGGGDDVNPCSRTSPCLTFAGAISKTHEGGEIDVIEPGAYGTVSITKAITIDGGTGAGWASILALGTGDGVSINITSGTHVDDAAVTLRNLTITGMKQVGGGGHIGINIVRAQEVHIENVNVQGFTNSGINIDSADSVSVWVQNATFTKDNTAMRSTTTSGFVSLFMNQVHAQGNTNGFHALASTFATIRDSYFGGNTGATNGAVTCNSGSSISIENSMFAGNAIAVNSQSGGTVRISNNCFYNNTTALSGAGTIATATNTNKFAGNGSDGTTNATITLQ